MKLKCEVCTGAGCGSCDYKGYLDDDDIERQIKSNSEDGRLAQVAD